MEYNEINIFPNNPKGYEEAADAVLETIFGKSHNIPVPKILRELVWWKKEDEPITKEDMDMVVFEDYVNGDISEEQKEEINNYLYSTFGLKLDNFSQKMKNKQKIKEMGFEEETFQKLLEILKDEDFREVFLIAGNTLKDKVQNIYYSFKEDELTKLLFCVAMRYEELLEEKDIAEEEMLEYQNRLQIVKRNLKLNSKMVFKYQSGQKNIVIQH